MGENGALPWQDATIPRALSGVLPHLLAREAAALEAITGLCTMNYALETMVGSLCA
jgi:hypothetical protein